MIIKNKEICFDFWSKFGRYKVFYIIPGVSISVDTQGSSVGEGTEYTLYIEWLFWTASVSYGDKGRYDTDYIDLVLPSTEDTPFVKPEPDPEPVADPNVAAVWNDLLSYDDENFKKPYCKKCNNIGYDLSKPDYPKCDNC